MYTEQLILPLLAFTFSFLAMNIGVFNDIFRLFTSVLGIIGLFLIPGYCIASFIRETWASINDCMDVITLSFILGFALQMFNTLILYSSVSIFYALDFRLALLFMTFLECIGIQMVNYFKLRYSQYQPEKFIKEGFRLLPLLVFISAFVIRLYYQQFVQGFTTDGALYLDQARALVTRGNFTSNVINDGTAYPFANQLGFNGHIGAYFAIALFFAIGDVSLSSAKIMAAFSGALIVVLIYWLTYYFSRNKLGTAFATFLAMFHPTLIAMSCLIQGPEVVSALFTLTAFIFLLKYLEKLEFSLAILFDIFIFLANISWTQDFYIFMVFIIFMSIISLSLLRKEFKASLYEFIALIFCSFYVVISIRFSIYPVIYLSMTGSLVVGALFLKSFSRRLLKGVGNILILSGIVLIFLSISFIRSYAFPQVHLATAPSLGARLKGILPKSSVLPYNVLNNYVQYLKVYAGEPLMYMAVLSLFVTSINRRLAIPIILLVSYLYSSIFSYPIFTYSDGFRFFIVPSSLVIILAASFLSFLTEQTGQNIMFTFRFASRKLKGRVNIAWIIATSILILTVLPIFTTFYASYLEIFNNKLYIKNTAGWTDSMITWIHTNTMPNDIFASRKPRELAWLADRVTVGILKYGKPQSELDLFDLCDIIREFNVSYLIVDKPFLDSYPKLNVLASPENSIPGFELVFKNESQIGKLLVYNVSTLKAYQLRYVELSVISFDNLEGLRVQFDTKNQVPRGFLSIDFEDKMEGKGSLKVESNWLPLSNIYIAKFYFENSKPFSISNFSDIKFFIKINTSITNLMYFQLWDSEGNYRSYLFRYKMLREWDIITIPVTSYNQQSETPLNLSDVKTIIFWFESSKPFSLKVDNLRIGGWILQP